MSGHVYVVNCLPARHGDSILVEYGDQENPARILIDGGPAPSYQTLRDTIGRLPPEKRRFELLVVTHIDADHIDGVLMLLQDNHLAVNFDDVWFNGWPQLESLSAGHQRDVLAPQQGEFLGYLMHEQGRSWNSSFAEDRRCVVVADSGPLPSQQLPGGATVTLLSPLEENLLKLRRAWVKALEEAGMQPGSWEQAKARLSKRTEYQPRVPRQDVYAPRRFGSDTSVANGASIAFVLDYRGHRVLFGADAHVSVLTRGLRRLAGALGVQRVPLDAVKLSHHGSMANIDGRFLDTIDVPRFLVSTNGAYFRHPDPETIRLLAERSPGAEIRFNYRCMTTEVWEQPSAVPGGAIRAVYPPEGQVLNLGA
ncbi:ComEC/Rec2 family competence protein [Streptomyces sp. NPDC001135]